MEFSVLISVYTKDSAVFLSKALRSVCLEQSLKPNQVVLVKDGPLNDDLNNVVDFWFNLSTVNHLRFDVCELTENIGLAGALNYGLEHCEYDLVARMDADDISHKSRFSEQVDVFVSDINIDIVGTFALEIDDQGNEGRRRAMPVSHEGIMAALWACPFIHPSVMFKRDKILQLGGYNCNLRRRQDYELWFRCAHAEFKFHNIPSPLLFYRFSSGSHVKQSITLSFEQGALGFRSASMLNMPLWQRLACFIPFGRSLFPNKIQHLLYVLLAPFDPRKKR